MPKQLYKLNDFSGGLNTLRDGADIADSEVQTAQNVMFNVYGGIQPSYSLAQTANKISAYQADEITDIEPGYGLGYFETDHVRDPVTVAQTSSIAGDDNTEGSATGFIARTNGGLLRELEYKISGTQQNLASSFPVGTLVQMTASTFPANGIDSSAQGLYHVVDTNSNNIVFDRAIPIAVESPPQVFWGATLKGFSFGDSLILVANPAANDIDVFSTGANNYTHNTIVLRSSASTIASKVKYYRVEDAIRCCDTADTNDCKIQWYGWVQRRHFSGANNTEDSNSYMAYYANDNTLDPPTDGTIASTSGTAGALASYQKIQESDSSAAISLTAGGGFNIAVATETDEDGLIERGTYEFAQTFIYDDNQESLPLAYTDTHAVSEDVEFKSLSLNVATVGPFDERISGGRIYIRKKGVDSEYIMLLDIHLGKGCRTKLSDEYTDWDNPRESLTGNTTDGNANITNTSNDLAVVGMSISGTGIPLGATITAANNTSNVITISDNATADGTGVTLTLTGSFYSCPDRLVANNFRVTELGYITYEVINGFSSSVFSNALGDQGEHWKDVVVSNNRVFVCNVTIKDEETGSTKAEATVKSYPDRIMYSMPNRYDTFPSHNFIEAAKGDADVYIAIEAYADRLLAYKRYSVDIINIAGNDRDWFLEESRQYQGVAHPEAVKRTQYGLVWANEQGLFLYNGSNITNLKENKIDDFTWATHVSPLSSIIYDQRESMVFVVANMSNNGDAYMCDLKKGNFTFIKDFILDTNDGITNSVDAETERTYIGHDSASAVDIYQIKRDVIATTNTKFRTRDIDFGNPAQVKKIYAVHLTYKSDVALTNLFTIVEDDNTSTALAGTISASASNWAKVKITPSSPITCNKASLNLDTSSTSAKVYINDISIEYRALYRKGT